MRNTLPPIFRRQDGRTQWPTHNPFGTHPVLEKIKADLIARGELALKDGKLVPTKH